MARIQANRLSAPRKIALAVFLLALSQTSLAHETEEKIADPGFRPESEYSQAFLDALDTAVVAVYPTIIRRANRTANSYESRDQIVAFLNEHDVVKAVAGSKRIDLGRMPRISQWDIFTSDMARIAESEKGRRADAQYHLFMEILLPVSDGEVFGVECYMLDSDGNNAFSFLLNSHHQAFVSARLFAKDSSEAARNLLLEKATLLGVTALHAQIERAMAQPATDVELQPVASCSAEYTINELPMYGHLQKTPEQEIADTEYIRAMTRDGRSREDAADSAARLGWNFFYKGDCATAIKRFNQAWLLDPDNQLALWGFGAISLDRGEFDAATTYLELAIQNGPENPKLRSDYEQLLTRR